MYFNELIYIGDKIFDIKNKELLIYIAWFESSKDIIYSTINIKGDIVKKADKKEVLYNLTTIKLDRMSKQQTLKEIENLKKIKPTSILMKHLI